MSINQKVIFIACFSWCAYIGAMKTPNRARSIELSNENGCNFSDFPQYRCLEIFAYPNVYKNNDYRFGFYDEHNNDVQNEVEKWIVKKEKEYQKNKYDNRPKPQSIPQSLSPQEQRWWIDHHTMPAALFMVDSDGHPLSPCHEGLEWKLI